MQNKIKVFKWIKALSLLVSACFCWAFLIVSLHGYLSFDSVNNSAPFSATLLVYALSLALPALIFFILFLVMRSLLKDN